MEKHYWWDGSDLMANGFLPMLMSEGADNVTVEFYPKDKRLVIRAKETKEECGNYDDTHECPIDCS